MPSPPAAAIVAGFVWIGSDYLAHGIFLNMVAAVITAFTALLMVSNIRYRSFKDLDLKKQSAVLCQCF